MKLICVTKALLYYEIIEKVFLMLETTKNYTTLSFRYHYFKKISADDTIEQFAEVEYVENK